MAYWKGLDGTEKEGQFGTMSDGESIPNSKEIRSGQYQALLDVQMQASVERQKRHLCE